MNKPTPNPSQEGKSEIQNPNSEIARRTCLMCGEKFPSAGPHNRRCPGCNKKIGDAEHRAIYKWNRASRKKAIF